MNVNGERTSWLCATISIAVKFCSYYWKNPVKGEEGEKSLIKGYTFYVAPFLNFFMVWEVGFEPTKQYAQDFKPCSFDQTRIFPLIIPNTLVYDKRLFLRDCQHPSTPFGYIMSA